MQWRFVDAYEPHAYVAWHDMPSDPDLRRSCAGDFASRELNTELRRFLFRDAVPLLFHGAVLFLTSLEVFVSWETLSQHAVLLSLRLFVVVVSAAEVFAVMFADTDDRSGPRQSAIRQAVVNFTSLVAA